MEANQILEEINLKALAALTTIIQDEKRGLLTKGQAATGIRGIFDSVSGLVSQECFDLISLAANEYKDASEVDVNLIRSGDNIVGVMRFPKTGAILEITNTKPRRFPGYNDTDENAVENVKAEAQAIFEKLKARREW